MELRVLFKNNILVKSKNTFSVEENRALQLVFLAIQKQNDHKVKIEQRHFEEIIKDNNLKSKIGIETLLLGLVHKVIELKYADDKKWRVLGLVSDAYWDKEEEEITIEVPTYLQSLLVDDYKKDGFTPLELTNYATLGSSNSQRMYELLRCWSKYNKDTVIEYKVSELREYLELQNQYGLFSDFRKKVIEKSLKEFEKEGLFKVNGIEYIRKKKVVVSIKFHVRDLKPKSYDFNSGRIDSNGDKPLDGQIDLDYIVENNIVENVGHKVISSSKPKELLSDRTLKELSKTYGEEEVNISYEILKTNNSIERIKAPKKYIIGILNNRKNKNNALNKVKISPKLNSSNFTQRTYDYDKLERQLLGWASDEEYEEE